MYYILHRLGSWYYRCRGTYTKLVRRSLEGEPGDLRLASACSTSVTPLLVYRYDLRATAVS